MSPFIRLYAEWLLLMYGDRRVVRHFLFPKEVPEYDLQRNVIT